MPIEQSPDKIRKVAAAFDDALTNRNIEEITSAFADDCEIRLLGVKLTGKEGVKEWLNWLFKHLSSIEFVPVTIMVEGNVFFEEFIVRGTLPDGKALESKQAEVLIYEDYKIKSLRLYFDRLDFAEAVARGPISRRVVGVLIRRSLEGLQ
jgi:ketosteroid isomerase-like protein